jgi:hypothetical protein
MNILLFLFVAFVLLLPAHALIEEGRLASAIAAAAIALLGCLFTWCLTSLPYPIDLRWLILAGAVLVVLAVAWPYGLALWESRAVDEHERDSWVVANRNRLHCVAVLAAVHMPVYLSFRGVRFVTARVLAWWTSGLEFVLGAFGTKD